MRTILLHALLLLLVTCHGLLIGANIAAFFILPFKEDWYVAAPLMSFLFNLTFSKWRCPLTELENSIRKELGMRAIGGFIGHYAKRPLYTALGVRRRIVQKV